MERFERKNERVVVHHEFYADHRRITVIVNGKNYMQFYQGFYVPECRPSWSLHDSCGVPRIPITKEEFTRKWHELCG